MAQSAERCDGRRLRGAADEAAEAPRVAFVGVRIGELDDFRPRERAGHDSLERTTEKTSVFGAQGVRAAVPVRALPARHVGMSRDRDRASATACAPRLAFVGKGHEGRDTFAQRFVIRRDDLMVRRRPGRDDAWRQTTEERGRAPALRQSGESRPVKRTDVRTQPYDVLGRNRRNDRAGRNERSVVQAAPQARPRRVAIDATAVP